MTHLWRARRNIFANQFARVDSLAKCHWHFSPEHPSACPRLNLDNIPYKIPVTKTGILYGGPAYTFSKPENPAELIDDLVLLYTKLVNLGMEYRNGKVYLADLEEKDA